MPAEDLMEYKEPVYPISPEKVCPDGFRRIEDSCFYIEMEKLSYDQAEKRCSDKGGSLFAPVSQAQWNHLQDEVTSMTPPYFWTWTGIKKTTPTEDPHFKIEGAMDASSVNWLMRPYSDASNGWSSMATCAAFYNMEKSTSNYVYFYPCSLQYHSVCQTGLMDPVVSNQLRRMRFKLRHRY
ncbi:lectin C-type domain protein [Cooperia oncophora]